jgi:hypothetical protein
MEADMALDRAKIKARLVGADTSAIRERVLREQQERKETLDWFKHRSTWAPTMTEQQKQEQEKYIAENNLPF